MKLTNLIFSYYGVLYHGRHIPLRTIHNDDLQYLESNLLLTDWKNILFGLFSVFIELSS